MTWTWLLRYLHYLLLTEFLYVGLLDICQLAVVTDCCSFLEQAVIEDVSLKQQIFADLEKCCPPHCILASNTSTIDLNLIGDMTRSQDRVVGAHFFRSYPVTASVLP